MTNRGLAGHKATVWLIGRLSLLCVIGACGARTGLSDPIVARSSDFCVEASYASGFSDVGLVLLLDDSDSMAGMKWDTATAAVAGLVADPRAAGLAVALQFFPIADECNPDAYAVPAVGMAKLPASTSAIIDSLAAHKPHGATPTVPAMRGAITYARALAIADSTRAEAVALITDGAPDSCNSTTGLVVLLAREAAGAGVLTFVIGLANGYTDAMNRIAEAGGTGSATLIDENAKTAQAIVTAIEGFRETARQCRFAIPPVGAATIRPSDLAVMIRLDDGATIALPGTGGCFELDDANAPKHVVLCSKTCDLVHANPTSRVTVTAGCGANAREGGVAPEGGSDCGGIDVHCTPKCGMPDEVAPTCVLGNWMCPPGTVNVQSCFSCAPVPHGCCKMDDSFATASCVNAQWICPPGSTIFGSPGCKPPGVCAPALPCALGQYCKYPDASCASASTLGTCAAPGSDCPADAVPACGCDGETYASRCAASQASVDLSVGACAAPAGTFRCGPLFCRIADQVCRKTSDLTKVVAPNAYACVGQSVGCIDGCKQNPNGCSLCEPCPTNKTCNYGCTKGGAGERTLTCNRL